MKKIYGVVLCLLLSVFSLSAQVKLSEEATVSLLTASPWYRAVYAMFGHSAIRVRDDSTGVDVAYNYGFFDSSRPFFIYYFMRGETDYILGDTTLREFLLEYGSKGQQVTEQTLNFSAAEKQQLYNALYENALPENREYRYNFFYDNCATRPRDMVEKFAHGTIRYPETTKEQSYRDLVHECVHGYPWIEFGIDLLIGTEADKTIDVREKMFLPTYLMHALEGAVLQVNDTLSHPVVAHTEILLEADKEINKECERIWFTPIVTAFALLLVTCIVSFVQWKQCRRTKFLKIYDSCLFGIAGIAGVIIFFLICFSEHPATNPNWNLAWLHPVALIATVLFWVRSAGKVVYFYHLINFVLLTFFILLSWLIPQQLSLAAVVFSAVLWCRSGVNIWVFRKKRLHDNRFVSSKYLKAGWGQ